MSSYKKAYERWQQVEEERARSRTRLLSRRQVLRGSTIAALGGVAAALVGCSSDDDEGSGGSSSGSGSSGTASAGAGAPSSTPAAAGDLVAKAEAAFGKPETAYPLVNQYNWRYVDWWKSPARSGGLATRSSRAPSHWDPLTVVTVTPHPPFYNGLYRLRTEAGDTLRSIDSLNLDGQEFVPDLAQDVETNDDYTEWTFKLPANAKFHDLAPVNGRTMTAEDVVYSFDLYRNEGLWSVPLSPIDKIEAVDDTTVKFTMQHPYFALPAILGMPYYLIIAREHYEGGEDRWREQPIGTGPFVMTGFEPGQMYQATKNPEYWEKDAAGTQLPYLDGWTSRYYPDFNAQVAAFRSGELDSMAPTNPDQLQQLVDTVPEAYYTVGPHWATYQNAAIIQWENPTLADVRVRQALSMGTDRKALVDNLLSGAGTPY
ncbi:MAG: ABC transporter substrate-binding protein, partial [Dehalococcoidia bacterium]|nr:ABC transporter substrate-binding protein [Dehalococcoidia bacterium]